MAKPIEEEIDLDSHWKCQCGWRGVERTLYNNQDRNFPWLYKCPDCKVATLENLEKVT